MDPSTSFSSAAAANPFAHAVSVLVLVEDSQTMLGKWDDIRHRYLPALIHGLRTDSKMNPSFRIWWFTSSPTFSPLTTTVNTLADYNYLPNLNLGRKTDASLISTGTIRRCLNAYLASGKQRRTNQHLIVVAASPLLTGSEGPGPVEAGFDPWVGTALALCQEEIHLHLIVGPANESRSFRDLFCRTRYAQNLSEIPPWFEVDTTQFSILISGRSLQHAPQANPSRTSKASVPLLDTQRRSPETAVSSTSTSPMSPVRHISPTSSRRSSVSATSPPRADDRPGQQRSTTDTLGLVGYLQRMHGLTKKRTYGAKQGKRSATLVEGHVPGRPILPRLDLTAPYPRPPVRAAEGVLTSPGPSTAPPSQHSSPTTERPTADTRSRASWQPLSPVFGSASGQVSDSTAAAALRSLEAMAPRLTEFHTADHPSASARSPSGRDSGRGAQLMQALAHRDAVSAELNLQDMRAMASASAPAMGSADVSSSSRPSNLDRSVSLDRVAYYNMVPSASQTSSPLPSPSLTAPESSAGSAEDQPFIVTPEYEAFVAARFEEAVRSGAMHAASMTSNVSGTLSAPPVMATGEPMAHAQEMQQQTYFGHHPGMQGLDPQASLSYDSNAWSTVAPQFEGIGRHWDPDHRYVQDPSLYGGPSTGAWHPH